MPSPIKFSTEDLKDIIEPMMQFISAAYTCAEILPQIDDAFVRKQTHYFKVLTRDGLKRKDRKFNPKTDFKGGIDFASALCANNMCIDGIDYAQDYRSIKNFLADKDYLCGDYKKYRVEFFPNKKTKVTKSRAYINDDLILQTTVCADKTIMEYAKTHPDFAKELIRKTCWATVFYEQTKGFHTQTQMDKFIIQCEKNALQDRLFSLHNIPFIQAVENLRKFLFDTLITHHTAQIGADEQTAKQLLKANKDDIYRWAEKLGYIPDATLLIDCQHARDNLAHPDKFKCSNGIALCDDMTPIIHGFEQILTHLMHGKNLKFSVVEQQHISHTPLVQAPATIEANDISAYALTEDLDALGNLFNDYTLPKKDNGKPLTGRKKLEALATLGVIGQSDVPALETAFKTRNEFAHGQTTPSSGTMAHTSHIISSNLLNRVINHHQNHIGNH